MKRSSLNRVITPAATVAVLALTLAACGGDNNDGGGDAASGLSGSVNIDGSSTVGPMAKVAAELFGESNPDVKVTVGESGSGGGFEKFCAGETDISNASRPIEDDEVAACEKDGINFQEMVIANDALTVVVNADNDWATCLTVEQLNTIWDPKSEGKVTNWNQVDPSFPDEKLVLFGAGTDSGTFDYFTDAINGEEGASRTDYSPTENDNNTVQGVQGSAGGLGYFGYSYFEQNADNLTAVQVDGGDGCVSPSPETVGDGTYTPLARELYMYPSVEKAAGNEAALAYTQFFVDNDASISEAAQFIPLNDEQKATLDSEFADFQAAVDAG
ncbi:MAG TPA: PstS family phosphate ABC transporter substrate-binding protein [Actinomycetes bacterium]|nr:PstS family phosphate ABC transporter substrate-binding protein [Actinomycetes bacterium]